jgi:hypothetical protein
MARISPEAYEAQRIAYGLREDGADAESIKAQLNTRLDGVYFCNGTEIYMRNDPDHLPAIFILECAR